MSICTNVSFLNSISEFIILSGMIGSAIILIVYIYSRISQDDRAYAWSKIEIYQLLVSVFSAFAMVFIGSAFICQQEIYSGFMGIFSLPGISTGANGQVIDLPSSIYDAAKEYLIGASNTAFATFLASRYAHASYSVASRYSVYVCGSPWSSVGSKVNPNINVFNCIMGFALPLGAGAGIYISPFAGYSTLLSLTNLMMNLSLVEYITSITYLFLLEFSVSGIAFFMLPLGILVRMVPFSRRVGALLMTVAFVFMFVYPLVLSVFYVPYKISGKLPDAVNKYSEKSVNDARVSASFGDIFYNKAKGIISKKMPEFDDIFAFFSGVSTSFLYAMFIPTMAFIITIGAVNYSVALLGEEIDLSRIMRMI